MKLQPSPWIPLTRLCAFRPDGLGACCVATMMMTCDPYVVSRQHHNQLMWCVTQSLVDIQDGNPGCALDNYNVDS